jgi:hypothetical protein
VAVEDGHERLVHTPNCGAARSQIGDNQGLPCLRGLTTGHAEARLPVSPFPPARHSV